MDEDAFKQITARVLAHAEAGELEACERILIDQLAQVRGRDAAQELAALSNLASIYGRTGRVFESLILSRRVVQMARELNNAYREARALTGVCTGRHGLRVGLDLTQDVLRLRELMREFPVRDDTLVLNMEVAFVEFMHALDCGDLDEAHEHIERFWTLGQKLDREQDLTACVHLAGRAELALRGGDAVHTLMFLDEIRDRGVAAPFQEPELAVLRVEARIALGDLESARIEAKAALDALERAPAIATSDCVHFGGRLADVLAGPLDDMETARRAYDVVATAVFDRIRQVDTCMSALPELGVQTGAWEEDDLIRYRKSFLKQQRTLLSRVADMLSGQKLEDLRRIFAQEGAEGLITICAWCESVRGEDGRWIGVGHLVPRGGPFQITHGICPNCCARFS